MDYTALILKNKGVPCEFAEVELGENGKLRRIFTDEGTFKKVTLHIRFNHNAIADIEDFYGSLDSWQKAMDEKPTSTLRRTLAIVLGYDLTQTGEMMIEGESGTYSTAIGTAWAISNGVDPTVASLLHKQSLELAEKQRDEQTRIIKETLMKTTEEKPSRGKTGSQSGPKQTGQ